MRYGRAASVADARDLSAAQARFTLPNRCEDHRRLTLITGGFRMRRLFLGVVLLVLVTVVAHAADNTVAGVVARVEPGAIEVITHDGATKFVTTDSNTTYMKWILQKPWGQDPRADASFLRVGSRVRIELQEDNPAVARTVWIVVGRVGFD